MRALIQFFQKHHVLFLFLILEGIGFMMLIQNNYMQRIKFVTATDAVSGNIYEKISIWRDYLNLREQNKQLQDENTKLRNLYSGVHVVDSFVVPVPLPVPDSIVQEKIEQRYAYLSAKVINNSVNRQFNFITIDRGKKEGIEENMAVIGPDGIVGIVYGVSEHFARVMPVINRNFKVSAKFKKNNHFGSLSWEGQSYRLASMNEISLHIPVSKGDTVVVSGFSGSFPEGITIGIVEKVEPKDGSFYAIDVLLATDFRKLYYVTVIDDLLKKERQALEQQTSNMP